jgi:zinc protease
MLLCLAAPVLSAKANAMKIQTVRSPGGIDAWLVQEHAVPLIALRFVFEGGSAQNPTGKEGLANFLTAMLDEGAGDLDSQKYQERMEELAFRMGFEDSRDGFYGSFETLTANRDPSIDMLRLALNQPRFDADAVERVRKQLLSGLAFAAKNPNRVAGKAWSALAFPGHPYGLPADGTPQSIAGITREDLDGFRKRNFARDNLKVVAVGDISAEQLGELLDSVFGDLPGKAELAVVPQTMPEAKERVQVIHMDVPQSVVQFGAPGIAREDDDFMPAFVLNQILGGGGFASRLTEEVREKRGLAYSVYSYLQPYRRAAIFAGGVATKNEEVGRSLDVIRDELRRMAKDGPTPEELKNAKDYLTGSFALRFDTNAKIANQLLGFLFESYGIDYIDKRNAQVNAVTLADVKRVAARLLKADELIVTVVGKPQGLAVTK